MQKHPADPNERTAALSITALPFVSPRPSARPNYWDVPPVVEALRDYAEAEAIGRQYAVQFTQWLHANPELVGMGVLGWIASDIDFQSIDRSGYWVGFFSCIEGMLFDARAA